MSETVAMSHGDVEAAALAVGRLGAALDSHPLRRGWLYRARLQAAASAAGVPPAQLAAALEGLRLRWTPRDFGALSQALMMWSLLADEPAAPGEPESPHEEELAARGAAEAWLLADAAAPWLVHLAGRCWDWLREGRDPAPLWAALPRAAARLALTSEPCPVLASIDVFRPAADRAAFLAAFARGLAREADRGRALLLTLHGRWLRGRETVTGRRRHSRLALVYDALAQGGLLGPAALAAGLGAGGRPLSVRGAAMLLDELVDLRLAVEVTGRATRRLYGLRDLDDVALEVGTPVPPAQPAPAPESVTLRPAEDELAGLFAELDQVTSRVRRALEGH